MAKYDVMLARPTYRGHERREVGWWLAQTYHKAKSDPRIGRVLVVEKDDTPAPMVRNAILKSALDAQVDLVCMIDDDMEPDLKRPGSVPFWDTAFDFMTGKHAGRPCIVAAPYCGAPPLEAVMAMKWCNWQSDHPNVDHRMELVSREEAAQRSGVEQMAAIGTGLFVVSVDAYKNLPQESLPWFDYEYADEYQTKKATTEDIYFSRNLTLCGVPSYLLWDCWAAHWKPKRVMPPTILTSDMVAEKYRLAIQRGQRSDEKLIFMGEGEPEGNGAMIGAK